MDVFGRLVRLGVVWAPVVGGVGVSVGYVARIDVDEDFDLEGICVEKIVADSLCDLMALTH